MKKVICLVSGGIDSPVAAYQIGRLGFEIIPVYFDNSPFAGETTKNRMIECVRRLKKHFDYLDEAIIVPHGHSLQAFVENCQKSFLCVLCKRQMFRVAEQLCKKYGAGGIVTGEFLGSKASQTLENLYVISKAVNIPIIRPLLGFDKEEIQSIGKKIGTFDVSITPADCCSAVPKKPKTKARLQAVLEEESKVDIKKLVKIAVGSTQKKKI